MSNVEQQDTYQSWMERVAGGREARPLVEGELVKAPDPEPFSVIEFCRTERLRYVGEVGKKDGDYVYHFFANDNQSFPNDFADKMGDAFLEVFQFEERLEASYVPTLNSWAVRARGFADNPAGDPLALRLFTVLDQKLE